MHDDVRAIAAGDRGRLRPRRGAQPGPATSSRRSAASCSPMHAAAIETARAVAMRPVPSGTSTSSSRRTPAIPLDQNLYQAVKGMSAAAQVVRPGGVIVCAAECRDGFPDHGSYQEVLSSAPSPEALLAEIGGRPKTVPDQWQVQVQAKIQTRAAGRGAQRLPRRGPAGRGPPRPHRRRRRRGAGTRSAPPGRTPGSACCRRARRRSRTSRPDQSGHRSALTLLTPCVHSRLCKRQSAAAEWHAFRRSATVERRRQRRGATGVGTG